MAPHWLPTVGATLVAAVSCAYFWKRRHAGRCSIPQTKPGHEGYAALIGNTPLVELKSLSRLTGRTILVKCEHLNPGGTGKDRIARAILAEAEANGYLKPGGTVVEGTSGSTGIALAALCASRGYCCLIVMPDDQADEKKHLLERFGASVTQVKTAAIANPSHYVQQAKRLAQQVPGAFFANQFENLANFRAHLSTTGPEIWEQARGRVDAFVMSAGTGGTIAGVSQYLRQMNPAVKTVLADPPGSSLFHWAKHGVCWAPQQAERRVRKHRYDTIAEGIGLDRITANLGEALIDDAIRVADQDAVSMAHYLMRHEGLFVGSSSAMNVAAAVVYAEKLPPGSRVVTVLCDSGQRHVTRFWSREFVEGQFHLSWPSPSEADEAVRQMAARQRHGGLGEA